VVVPSQPMVLLSVAACALCCAAWAVAVIQFTRRPSQQREVAAPDVVDRPREEDRVRPAVDASGEPIWVDADELFWHEIVAWPRRLADAEKRRTSIS
jgi:hypothetical protein